jgi:hypothetical protein
MDSLDVARGETHAYIKRCLFGNIPEDMQPEEIYASVEEFGKHGYLLDAFIKQETTVQKAEAYLVDDGKALMSMANNVTMIKVVSLVRHLYDSLDDVLTYDTLSSRADVFLDMLKLHREEYDSIVHRNPQKYEAVKGREEDNTATAVAFSKILLRCIGLKQKSERVSQVDGEVQYGYTIANAEGAGQFLEWRNQEPTVIDFASNRVQQQIETRRDENELFQKFEGEQQSRVLELMNDRKIIFKTAVQIVQSDGSLEDW